MKKIISMILCISIFCSLCVPISATPLTIQHDDSVTYYVEQEIQEQDLQRQINEVLAELNKEKIEPYGRDPDAFDYYTEIVTVETKYATLGGYAGNQLEGGVSWDANGGAIHWSNTPAGATANMGVSFSVPIKLVTVSFDFGGTVSKNSSNIAYIANVGPEYKNQRVKLYVFETRKVQQINYYKTNKKTGERVALLVTAYPSTTFAYDFSIKVVK